MKMPLHKIDHIVLTTSNIEACLAFYEMLGFRVKKDGQRYALLQKDFKINVHLQGHELQPHAHLAKPGTLDICFALEGDLIDCQEELRKLGIAVSEIGVKCGSNGKMKSFYFRDPDHNLIELCSYESFCIRV